MAEATVIELVSSDERGHVRIAVEIPGADEDDEPSVIPFRPEWLVEPSAA